MSGLSARFLLRVDAFGCAAAAVVALVRGSAFVTIALAVSAVVIGYFSSRPDCQMPTLARIVAAGNVLWAVVVAVDLALGWIEGTDAVLIGLTIPYCLVLGTLQFQASRKQEAVVSGV